MSHSINEFKIGDLVVIKSYPKTNPLKGDPLHVPPIMCIVGIEIENKNKKTHDPTLGKEIAGRVKYRLVWFDNKKSEFIEKIMYEKFLIPSKIPIGEPFTNYEWGAVVKFATQKFELSKTKESTKEIETKDLGPLKKGETRRKDSKSKKIDTDPLLTYASPDFVVTGIKQNENPIQYDDKGGLKNELPKILIKIMWFNPNQQKYTEYEISKECLFNELEDEESVK